MLAIRPSSTAFIVGEMAAFGLIRTGNYVPMRRQVYLSKSLHHVLKLQLQHPGALIALPSSVHFTDLERYQETLRMPLLCSRGSLAHPLRSMNIIAHTPCTKLLLGTLLLEFSEEKERIVGSEEVQLI